MRECETAIRVRGVNKTYGTKKRELLILDNIEMTVRKGSIYGLLGPSGSGKTTLLNSIIGKNGIDSGQIRVFGKKPGRIPVHTIGYMPQEIALLDEFSVKGAVQHYGWLYGMTNDEIEHRFQFLANLLDLPPPTRLIEHLSGGQQRRVSLAVALVHNPDVLILDEPTVGLDPVLRRNIWDYLVEIAQKESKTVIITTHYIEEATQANCIGLIRKGKMLTEGEPAAILSKFNCSSLEEAFLHLITTGDCKKEPDTDRKSQADFPLINISENDDYGDDQEAESVWTSVQSSWKFTTASRAKALLLKNYHKFVRNKTSLAYSYFFPAIQMAIFFAAIGGDPKNLSLGIVNQELGLSNTCMEYAVNQSLGGSPSTSEDSRCDYSGLSCKYILGLPKALSRHKYYKTAEEAKLAVESGSITAYLVFHKNFTVKTGRLREDARLSNNDIEEVQINTYSDKTGYHVAHFVEKVLMERYNEFSEELEAECGFNPRGRTMPLKIMDAVYGTNNPQATDQIAPGALLMISVMVAVAVSGLSIVMERTEGTWDRTLIAGASKAEIVFFHFVVMVAANAVQNLVLFVVTFGIFQTKCEGSLVTVLLLVTCQGIVGVALGIFLSVISKTGTDCIQMCLGLYFPFCILTGIIWPIEGMNTLVRQITFFITPPVTAVEALTNVVIRGWSICNYHVAKGFYSSFSWVIVLNVAYILVLKFEKR